MPTVKQQEVKKVTRWRKSVGFTISGLAEAAEVDLRGLRRFFNAEGNPTVETLEKLYTALRTEERRLSRLKAG